MRMFFERNGKRYWVCRFMWQGDLPIMVDGELCQLSTETHEVPKNLGGKPGDYFAYNAVGRGEPAIAHEIPDDEMTGLLDGMKAMRQPPEEKPKWWIAFLNLVWET